MAVSIEQVHVARQPILDARQQVFGYELLYRAAAQDTAAPTIDASISARVIGDALLGIGFETLTDGRRAFINLDGRTLLADASGLLDPDQVVLEVLESVEVTPEVIAMCESLRSRGYAIALDDFVPGSPAEALVKYARFVKLDVLALTGDTLTATTRRLLQAGVSVVAEKVETAEAFERARAAGCSLFQGYYFCRPVTFSGRALPANHVTQMRLVAALNQPSVSLGTIEDLLKHDASLSYRVLRSVNSAGFGLRREIHSIREALLLLGLDQVRKWSSIWALAGLNRAVGLAMTVIRARCARTARPERSIVRTTAPPTSCSASVRCSTCCWATRWRRSRRSCRSIRRSTQRCSAPTTRRGAPSTRSCTTSRAGGTTRPASPTASASAPTRCPTPTRTPSAGHAS
ncbi:MAG: EAL domain-containing protein [Candidatus Binatia bacterium]